MSHHALSSESLEDARHSSARPSALRSNKAQRHRLFLATWYAVNSLLVISILLAAYSVGWEYSTRRYLKGFSDAIVPVAGSPEEKITSILNWMSSGPARNPNGPAAIMPNRDPTDTLNYDSLMRVCGSATNAFINLTDSAGLSARRLLLLDSNHQAKHVVAEVLIEGRWIIVDPAFRVLLRGTNGKMLTREQLADPETFTAATRDIPRYDPSYTFERTAHIRMSRIRSVGLPLRHALNVLLPGWEDSTTVSLLVERQSLAVMVVAIVLLLFLSLVRISLRWYGERFLKFRAVRIRDQIRRACIAFLDTAR
jgi:hypothetical protein